MRQGRARKVLRLRLLLVLVVMSIVVLPAGGSVAREARPLEGIALVVGNADYVGDHADLPNPVNDALAMKELFDRLGFQTTLVTDRDARRLARDLDNFVDDAEGADVAVVYYAGHGIEADGENFLVPIDADLAAPEVAGEALVPISAFLERIQATVPVSIVMLDA
ncbi:MAG: caspase family protein [Rhizobiaceae bacterium]|nr:caspase family protein [Rhizobiaceae bacterium]